MHPGLSTSLDRLIELRFRANQFKRARSQLSKAQLLGRFSSNVRGRGLDFAESRHYQPGDELRSIDWRVTARTQQAHTKLFTEEKERPMLIALDQRKTMCFGSKTRLKSVQAAELAALLVWNSFHQGDRVGGFLWNDQEQKQFKPKASQSATLHLLREIASINQRLTQTLNQQVMPDTTTNTTTNTTTATDNTTDSRNTSMLALILRQLRRVSKPGTHINMISDFSGFDQDCVRELSILRKHCDISAYKIYDSLEQQLPREQALRFSGESGTVQINARREQTRQAYLANFDRHQQKVHDDLSRLKIPVLDLASHESLGASRNS